MDDDDKEPEDKPPEPAPDAAQEEGAELRKVSEEELKQIFAAHAKWVETGEKEGKQADLSRTDLQGADLVRANLRVANLFRANLQGASLAGADLQGANLREANLQGANLFGANLQGARLGDAKLQGANLGGANLREALLANANLEEAKRLTSRQLAGADLTGAALPPDIAKFEGLDQVENICRIARPIFTLMILLCLYAYLSIASTTNVALHTNSAAQILPNLSTAIPTEGFYWVAPLLLLFLYIYLNLYLSRLWEMLANLPAVFPDGEPVHEHVYPWLVSGLVRAHSKLLKHERTLLARLENCAAIFLAWWIVPVTVFVFWGRYLPRHEWAGTGLHVALLILSIGSAILLHHHAVGTLRRDVTAFRWRRPWSDRRTYQAAVPVGLGVVFALVSLGAIEGDARRNYAGGPVVLGGVATWVPYAFDSVGHKTFANLREADVSTKPATWTGLAERPTEGLDMSLREKARTELAQVKGARFQAQDLRHADAVRAFLAKADLRDAKLQGAFLLGTNFQGADLDSANLQGADLRGANLQGARLAGTHLTEAKGLTWEQLDEACGNDKTKLPKYLADYQMKPCSPLEQSPSN